MKIRWKAPAYHDLLEIKRYISRDNAQAAQRVAAHIRKSAKVLPENPLYGRAGKAEGTRELVVTKYPYILVYRVTDMIEILRVMHTSRDDWSG